MNGGTTTVMVQPDGACDLRGVFEADWHYHGRAEVTYALTQWGACWGEFVGPDWNNSSLSLQTFWNTGLWDALQFLLKLLADADRHIISALGLGNLRRVAYGLAREIERHVSRQFGWVARPFNHNPIDTMLPSKLSVQERVKILALELLGDSTGLRVRFKYSIE